MKKYSYRQFDKRRFAHNVLRYLESPGSMKEDLDCSNSTKEAQKIRAAMATAKQLLKDHKAGRPINLSQYTPFISRIKSALQALS